MNQKKNPISKGEIDSGNAGVGGVVIFGLGACLVQSRL